MLKLEWSPNTYCRLAEDFAYNFVEEWNNGNWEDSDWHDALMEDLDNDLIYYESQWNILKEYCTPQEADWNTAFECYLDDIYSCISEVEEEEEEEEEIC